MLDAALGIGMHMKYSLKLKNPSACFLKLVEPPQHGLSAKTVFDSEGIDKSISVLAAK